MQQRCQKRHNYDRQILKIPLTVERRTPQKRDHPIRKIAMEGNLLKEGCLLNAVKFSRR